MIPFIHINCAMSADGKIAGPERRQVRISSDEDMGRVMVLRRLYDGILVGVGTVLADDPHLTVKGLENDENPVRIVLDPRGRTPGGAAVLDGRARTIMVTDAGCGRTWAGADVIRSPGMDLRSIMEEVYEQGVESVLVEGGGETIASFFRNGLVDRYTVFVGGLIIGGRTSPTPADGDVGIGDPGMAMRLVSSEVLGNGALLTFEPY